MAKPIVDGIARSLADTPIPVIKISISSSTGQHLAFRNGVRGVPTLIVFDDQGQVRLRQVGKVQKDAVLEMTRQLAQKP